MKKGGGWTNKMSSVRKNSGQGMDPRCWILEVEVSRRLVLREPQLGLVHLQVGNGCAWRGSECEAAARGSWQMSPPINAALEAKSGTAGLNGRGFGGSWTDDC